MGKSLIFLLKKYKAECGAPIIATKDDSFRSRHGTPVSPAVDGDDADAADDDDADGGDDDADAGDDAVADDHVDDDDDDGDGGDDVEDENKSPKEIKDKPGQGLLGCHGAAGGNRETYQGSTDGSASACGGEGL